jgi:hypothetical protein
MLALLENEDVFPAADSHQDGRADRFRNMLVQLDQRCSHSQLPKRSSEEDAHHPAGQGNSSWRSRIWTEPQAHQFLQRMSMDTSSKMADVAKLILSSLD